MKSSSIPVITLDGPSGTGKGTLARLLAQHLAWHMLDSGIFYRAYAWALNDRGLLHEDQSHWIPILGNIQLDLRVQSPGEPPEIWYAGQNITMAIREEACGTAASVIAAVDEVRSHLLPYQRRMRQLPGLVADGRDMGSTVFPDAIVKFYLDATVDVRAQRRFDQLNGQGKHVSLRSLRDDLVSRDERDAKRDISPMKLMPDMLLIDTSDLTIEQVFSRVLEEVQAHLHIH